MRAVLGALRVAGNMVRNGKAQKLNLDNSGRHQHACLATAAMCLQPDLIVPAFFDDNIWETIAHLGALCCESWVCKAVEIPCGVLSNCQITGAPRDGVDKSQLPVICHKASLYRRKGEVDNNCIRMRHAECLDHVFQCHICCILHCQAPFITVCMQQRCIQ